MDLYEEIIIKRSFLEATRSEIGDYIEVCDESILKHPIDLPPLSDRERGIVPVEFKALDEVCEKFGGLKLWYNPKTGDGKYQEGIASSYLVDASVVTNILFLDDLETCLGSLSTTVLSREGNRPPREFLDALVKSYNRCLDFAQLIHPFEGRIEVLMDDDRIILAKPPGPLPRIIITRRKCGREKIKAA